jgi:hypothetical protein
MGEVEKRRNHRNALTDLKTLRNQGLRKLVKKENNAHYDRNKQHSVVHTPASIILRVAPRA